MKNYTLLSKSVSYILRHAPWEYELELDSEGWVYIEELLSALNQKGDNINLNDLENMIKFASKQRHEIADGKIRALYGHSVPERLSKVEHEPPGILYHGTSPETAKIIISQSLKPMNRQYVHLSTDLEMANHVGSRKASIPVILKVNAKEAFLSGVKFYIGNEKVWLADEIPARFIEVI